MGQNPKTLKSGNHQDNLLKSVIHWNLKKQVHESRSGPKFVQIWHEREAIETKYQRCWTK